MRLLLKVLLAVALLLGGTTLLVSIYVFWSSITFLINPKSSFAAMIEGTIILVLNQALAIAALVEALLIGLLTYYQAMSRIWGIRATGLFGAIALFALMLYGVYRP